MAKRLAAGAQDQLLINLVHSCTDLTDEDLGILLEVSHSLPFISDLESGDVYINVLTKNGESMVIAQYRHPNCDLYGRDIVGEVVKKTDEPAVYRALEHGLPGRGMIGIIDAGRVIVRHTVSPIRNHGQKVIGALTYEYPNTNHSDTEPVRIRAGRVSDVDRKIDWVAGYLQDGFLIFDESGICTFANAKAEKMYREIGYEQSVIGQRYESLRLIERSLSDVIMKRDVIKGEVHFGDYVYEERISAIWEDGVYEGITVILQDKTKIRQMEEEIAYRITSISETHHRVKNNLQTIISLVGLEAAQTKDAEVKDFSKTIISRICSISVIYDLLARSGTDSVSLKSMITRVVDSALEDGAANGCQIHANVKGDDLELAASMAATVALIINELIQNSLKYAFQGRGEGGIWLTIGKGDEYSWVTVRDDGCGFDKEARKKQQGGLGLKLVESLVRSKLKGEITVSSDNQGTATRFSFRQVIK